MKLTALLEFSGSAVSMTTEADHQLMRSASSSSGFGALGCLEQLALAWKPLLDASQVFVLGFVVADGRMLFKPPPGPPPRPWPAAVEQPRLGIRQRGRILAADPELQQRFPGQLAEFAGA